MSEEKSASESLSLSVKSAIEERTRKFVVESGSKSLEVDVDEESLNLYEELTGLASTVADRIDTQVSETPPQGYDVATIFSNQLREVLDSPVTFDGSYVYVFRFPEEKIGFLPSPMWNKMNSILNILTSYICSYYNKSSRIVVSIEKSESPLRQEIIQKAASVRTLFPILATYVPAGAQEEETPPSAVDKVEEVSRLVSVEY